MIVVTPGHVGEQESTGWRGGGPAPHNLSPTMLLTQALCGHVMWVCHGQNVSHSRHKSQVGAEWGKKYGAYVSLGVCSCFLCVRVVFVMGRMCCGHLFRHPVIGRKSSNSVKRLQK
jgi:hypothetical protein